MIPVKDGVFPESLDRFDGFIVTGSPASVHDPDPWVVLPMDHFCVEVNSGFVLFFFQPAPEALIWMEACPGSQWFARKLIEMGHGARIIPARFVKPYVKSNKADMVGAAAIAEAVTGPTMRLCGSCSPPQCPQAWPKLKRMT